MLLQEKKWKTLNCFWVLFFFLSGKTLANTTRNLLKFFCAGKEKLIGLLFLAPPIGPGLACDWVQHSSLENSDNMAD